MWQVEMNIGNEWENVWQFDDTPAIFDTQAEAEEALDEHLEDQALALLEGYIESVDSRTDFRVVEIIRD